MKFYNTRKKHNKTISFKFLPYRYHIQKYCESSYEWIEIGYYISYRNSIIEFERLKVNYPSLHFRLIYTLDIC